MSTVTDNDLKELKNLINEVRLNQERIITRLEDWKPSIDKIADLSEKVEEYKNWKQVSIIYFTHWLFNISFLGAKKYP